MNKDIPTKCRYFGNKLVDLEMITSISFRWDRTISGITEHATYKGEGVHRDTGYLSQNSWWYDANPYEKGRSLHDKDIEIEPEYTTNTEYINIHILCNRDETVVRFKTLNFDSRIDDERSFGLRKEVQEKLCKLEIERIMYIKKEK